MRPENRERFHKSVATIPENMKAEVFQKITGQNKMVSPCFVYQKLQAANAAL